MTMQTGHVQQVHVTSASMVDDALEFCGVNVGAKAKGTSASESSLSRTPAVTLASLQQQQPSPQGNAPLAKRQKRVAGKSPAGGRSPSGVPRSSGSPSVSTRAAAVSTARLTRRFRQKKKKIQVRAHRLRRPRRCHSRMRPAPRLLL